MLNKLEIFLEDEWKDYTIYLEQNSIVRQSRCDDVFATGNLQIRCSRPTNIPPYTPLRINEEEYWLCNSTCRRYLTKTNLFIHNIELLELTAILSCYILGSKNFSVTGTNKKDYQKVNIIRNLMRQKYGVTIDIVGPFETLLHKEQEFTFGPGTTMYDAILEILTSYEKVKIRVISCDPSHNKYSLRFIIDSESYILQEEFVLDEYSTQQSAYYGRILESEMTNVIDRTNTILVKDLTMRSEDVHMTADNSCLVLPTRCERVVDFGMSSPAANLYCQFSFGEEYMKVLDELGFRPSSATENGEYIKRYEEWMKILKLKNGYSPLQIVLEETIVGKFDLDKNTILESLWKLKYLGANVGNTKYLYLSGYNDVAGHVGEILDLPVKWSLKDKILSKDKWNMLEDREKPKYVYYESGSNKIEGMNNYYKNDFWNTIIGSTVHPFLYYAKKNEREEFDLDDNLNGQKSTHVTTKYFLDLEHNFDTDLYTSLYYSYWIEYYPIVDPFVLHRKTIKPNNEGIVKNLARSYDKNSNFIDFDRLIHSLSITNNMMGLPEYTVEYRLPPNQRYPKAFNRLQRHNIDWIITSVSITSNYKESIAQINLASSYNKVAEAIGVKSQFNETKNPLDNIINRPVFWIKDDIDNTRVELPSECWAKLQISGKILYKRVVLMEKDNVVYAYFEAIDQYCFDKQSLPTGNTILSDNYHCRDISYCDSNNEVIGASVSLGTLPSLSREESLSMPIYNGNDFNEVIYLGCQEIYKDARERLIFTLIIQNCEIVPSPKFLELKIICDENIESWTAKRTHSMLERPIGPLTQGAFLFEGDTIEVSAIPKKGYAIVGDPWRRIVINKIKATDRILDITFLTEQKIVGLAPIITAEISRDSSGMFDYFQYTIKNPNAVNVSATVNIYLQNGERFDSIIHELAAGESHLNGFETQRDITSVEVIFYSSLFSNNPGAHCQVLRK